MKTKRVGFELELINENHKRHSPSPSGAVASKSCLLSRHRAAAISSPNLSSPAQSSPLITINSSSSSSSNSSCVSDSPMAVDSCDTSGSAASTDTLNGSTRVRTAVKRRLSGFKSIKSSELNYRFFRRTVYDTPAAIPDIPGNIPTGMRCIGRGTPIRRDHRRDIVS
jgi:hypothetical protein